MNASSDSEKTDRFQIAIAVLIALTTLLGAALASRTALISSDAGDADFAGLAASLNAGETLAVNTSTMYDDYRTYTAYVRYDQLGTLLSQDLQETTDQAQSEELKRQMNTTWSMAVAVSHFFPTRYLRRDGSYDTQRQLGEAWAEAGQKKDLEPDNHFAVADALRSKADRLLAIIIVLTAAVWFFTLAQGLKHAMRYVLAIGGGGFAAVGIVMALIEEILR
jgi:Tfp pilus assembly protein PilV